MRRSLLFALLSLTACQATTAPTDGSAPRPDAGPCGRVCPDGQVCCPDGLEHACMALTSAGECPLPDLTISAERAQASARLVWEHFDADDCAIFEGCITEPGWRRLLRFETFTPNVGTGDMHLGVPTNSSPAFEFSECHRHFHFNGYADYRLLDSAGTEIGTGHKQAFCLLDSERVLDEPDVRTSERYSCFDQGISRGWGDSYYAGLPCQWVDVTDIAPGDYTLRITINGEHTLPEISYDNNVAMVPVHIEADSELDPTLPCDTTLDGPRDCGFASAGAFSCTPGEALEVGCGSACGLGSCEGDTMLRVCDGDAPCASHRALASGDDGCGPVCPVATFTCPASGRYTVLTAPYLTTDTDATCVPATRAAM